MKERSDWYTGIAGQISQLKDTLSEKVYKKYKLDLLVCVAERVDEFSPECGQCQIFRDEISTLTREASYLVQADDKDRRKAHIKMINGIAGHLQKQHKLVPDGYYIGIGMAIGAGIGAAMGAALKGIGGGLPIGIGIGLALGAALDAKARKENRILCPRKTGPDSFGNIGIDFSVNKTVLIIGLIALVIGGIVVFILLSRN